MAIAGCECCCCCKICPGGGWCLPPVLYATISNVAVDAPCGGNPACDSLPDWLDGQTTEYHNPETSGDHCLDLWLAPACPGAGTCSGIGMEWNRTRRYFDSDGTTLRFRYDMGCVCVEPLVGPMADSVQQFARLDIRCRPTADGTARRLCVFFQLQSLLVSELSDPNCCWNTGACADSAGQVYACNCPTDASHPETGDGFCQPVPDPGEVDAEDPVCDEENRFVSQVFHLTTGAGCGAVVTLDVTVYA